MKQPPLFKNHEKISKKEGRQLEKLIRPLSQVLDRISGKKGIIVGLHWKNPTMMTDIFRSQNRVPFVIIVAPNEVLFDYSPEYWRMKDFIKNTKFEWLREEHFIIAGWYDLSFLEPFTQEELLTHRSNRVRLLAAQGITHW